MRMIRSNNIMRVCIALGFLPLLILLVSQVPSARSGAKSYGPILLQPNPTRKMNISSRLPESGNLQDSAEPEAADSEAVDSTLAQIKTAQNKSAESKAEPQNAATKPCKKPGTKTEAELTETIAKEDRFQERRLPPLSRELEGTAKRLRRVVVGYYKAPFNTRDNTPATIIEVCRAFGCDSEVRRGGTSSEKINAITCLCWNYPCAKLELLKIVDGLITARIGYGMQRQPGEFLGVLAMSRVPVDYPVRVDDETRTLADLVEYEKLACREDADQFYRLMGLSRYVTDGRGWKNSLDEQWSVERLVKSELAKPIIGAPCGGVPRLLALSMAVDRRAQFNQPMTKPFRNANKYVSDFQEFAFRMQNDDGSWHQSFFEARGEAGKSSDRLRSTANILEWLAISLPDEKLQEAGMVRAVKFVIRSLSRRSGNVSNITSMSSQDIDARMRAVHALAVYDKRVFVPYDEQAERDAEKAAAEKAAAEKTAAETE